MTRSLPLPARRVAWSVLLLGLFSACGASQGGGDPIPAQATKLVVTSSPSSATAGEPLAFEVVVQTAGGETVTGASTQVTVALGTAPAGATLGGTASVAAVNGVARFSGLLLEKAAQGYTLVASAEGLSSATSAAFDVAPAAPAKLTFLASPTGAKVRTSLSEVRVGVLDAFGNLVDVAPELSVALTGGNPEAVLSGTLQAAPVAGVATFSDLSVDQQGSGFRLEAMAGTLDGATSDAFNVVDDLAPSPVALLVERKTSVQMELRWAASGDDGALGNASSFELRYSTSPIDAASFDSVLAEVAGSSLPRGSVHSVTLTQLNPSTQYYVALKLIDDANNASFSFADPATTQTNPDPCAGVTCAVSPPTCAADGTSRITSEGTCADVDGVATCQESKTTTACPAPTPSAFRARVTRRTKPALDQLRVSEVMHSPSAGTTAYVELTNTTGSLLDLRGLTVTQTNAAGTTTAFVIDSGGVPQLIGPKGTFVLARNSDVATNGGVSADAQYPDTIVLDGSGRFALADGTTTLLDFSYTPSFPQSPGKAMSLSSLVLGTPSERYPWYWCDAEEPLSGGDFGTPNAANSACGMTAAPTLDFCNIESPKTLPSTAPGSASRSPSRFHGASVTDRNPRGTTTTRSSSRSWATAPARPPRTPGAGRRSGTTTPTALR